MRKIMQNILQKWTYSVVGLTTAIKEEKSLWVYFLIIPVIIGLGVWLHLSTLSWAIIALAIFTVLAIEVLNTSLEAAVDTISFQYNVKVKKIKDIASGATLIINIGAIAVLLAIFIPEIKGVI